MTHVVGGRFDEHRNTSRVFPVVPGSATAAIVALSAWATANQAHARWLADGYPTLTEAEHVARFGNAWRKGSPLAPAA